MKILNPTTLIVYHKLHGLGYTYIASFREISQETGLSRRSCIYAVRALEKAGLVLTVKVATKPGIYTNGYITFPLNEPLSYSNPSEAQLERLRGGLSELTSHGEGFLIVPSAVSSLLERYSCTGANFAPGVYKYDSKILKVKYIEGDHNVYVNSAPSAEYPDKGKQKGKKCQIPSCKESIWVRFVDKQSLAKPGEIIIDLRRIFGVQKCIVVRNATVKRVRQAIDAVVAYAKKHVIRNLEAILVAAVVRGWKVVRKVVNWATARYAPKINTASDDKYRALYRLVSDKEAERNRKLCRPPEPEPEDKYRELYRLNPVEC